MIIKVGLTGNIGSGKSLVARIFEILKVPVFYADVAAKKILDSRQVTEKISDMFGSGLIIDGKVNRAQLAGLVFSDTSKLEQLNGIIHPAVRNQFADWAGKQESPYVIYEAAILHESGHYKNMDRIILVTAEKELRIKRVMQRDNVSLEMVEKRMANQWPEEHKIQQSDFIIDNNGGELLIPQVLKVHEKLYTINN